MQMLRRRQMSVFALLIIIGLSACSRRWNPATAVADAERDIATGKIHFCYVGGNTPTAPGVSGDADTFRVLNRYPKIEVGDQGCMQDKHFHERAEYAQRYNVRMWRYVSTQLTTPISN